MIRYFSRPLLADERKYTFRSCTDIEARSGLIGIMTLDITDSVTEKWSQIRENVKDDFYAEFSEIQSLIRTFFKDRESLRVYYNTHLRFNYSESNDGKAVGTYAGMRIITDRYCYLLRINPRSNKDNVMVYCYIQDSLKKHMVSAMKGIRFVDCNNREIFSKRDGDGITIHPCTVKSPILCRYIDPFNCLIGSKKWNLKELAEHLAKSEIVVMPAC